MEHKTFSLIVGIIFSVIAVLHLFRLIGGWEAIIGGLVLPIWVSWLVLAAAGYLAFSAYRFWRRV
ncbi:MAG: hypothetical protein Q8Q89_01315 [bacterium]|nr:hypothetical protein [bacterium]